MSMDMLLRQTKMRLARLEKGWSQQELGFKAKVSASDVSRIETGRMIPYPAQARRLARVLDLDVEELQDCITARYHEVGRSQ